MKSSIKLIFIYGIIINSIAMIFAIFINVLLSMFAVGNVLFFKDSDWGALLFKLIVILLLLFIMVFLTSKFFIMIGVGGNAGTSFFSQAAHVTRGFGQLGKMATKGVYRGSTGMIKNVGRNALDKFDNLKKASMGKNLPQMFLASTALSKMGYKAAGGMLRAQIIHDLFSDEKEDKSKEKEANTGEVKGEEEGISEGERTRRGLGLKKKNILDRALDEEKQDRIKRKKLESILEDPNASEKAKNKVLKDLSKLNRKRKDRRDLMEEHEIAETYDLLSSEFTDRDLMNRKEKMKDVLPEKGAVSGAVKSGSKKAVNNIKNFVGITDAQEAVRQMINRSKVEDPVVQTSPDGVDEERAYDIATAKDAISEKDKNKKIFKAEEIRTEKRNRKSSASQPGLAGGSYEYIADSPKEIEKFRTDLINNNSLAEDSAARMSEILGRGESVYGVSLSPELLKDINAGGNATMTHNASKANSIMRRALNMNDDNPNKRETLEQFKDQNGKAVAEELIQLDKEIGLGGSVNPIVVPDSEGNPIVVRDKDGKIFLHDNNSKGRMKRVEEAKKAASSSREAKKKENQETSKQAAAEMINETSHSAERVEPVARKEDANSNAQEQTQEQTQSKSSDKRYSAGDMAGVNTSAQSEKVAETETVEVNHEAQRSEKSTAERTAPNEHRGNGNNYVANEDHHSDSQKPSTNKPTDDSSANLSQKNLGIIFNAYNRMHDNLTSDEVSGNEIGDSMNNFTRTMVEQSLDTNEDLSYYKPSNDIISQSEILLRGIYEGSTGEKLCSAAIEVISEETVNDVYNRTGIDVDSEGLDRLKEKISSAWRTIANQEFRKGVEGGKSSQAYDGGNTGELKKLREEDDDE